MDLDDEKVQATKNLKNKCKCCEKIEFLKELNKSPIPNVKRVLKATLTSFSKRKGERGYCGFVSYKSYDLNYCPQCRKKVR